MAEVKQIKLCGLGGQGIVLAGTILGHAGINDGKWVAGSNFYGAAARGGSCRSEVVVSEDRLDFPLIIETDILIAMSQESYNENIGNVKKDSGAVIYDTQFVTPADISGIKQTGFPATGAAIEKANNRQVANMIMLGAAVAVTGLVSKEALLTAVEHNVDARFKELNLKAVKIGFNLGETEN